jgi:indolepyruvate ferredoxin oxidoreductase alpha subunit
MTGGQPTMAAGDELIELLKGLGVKEDHLRVIEPLAKYHEQNTAVIAEELKHPGLSVIVARRPCIQIRKPPKAKSAEQEAAAAAGGKK